MDFLKKMLFACLIQEQLLRTMIKLNPIHKREMELLKKSAVIRNHLNSGLTLIEVLIAVSLSVFVIGGGTFGVMAMMERNAILEARSQRRMELDRAINYIADEIQQANCVRIVKSGSKDCKNVDIPTVKFDAGIGATGVLLLTIPSTTPATSNTPNRVYFIATSTSTWVGPNTIHRYDGNISATTITRTNANELVDGITPPSSTQLKGIKDSCTNGGVFQGADGFYACINETTKTVDLYLYGKLEYVAGKVKKDPTQENLLVTTRVVARGTP